MEYLHPSLLLKLSPFDKKLISMRIIAELFAKILKLSFILRHHTLIDHIIHRINDLNWAYHIFSIWIFLILNFLDEPQYLNRTVVFNLSTVFPFDENLSHSNSTSVDLLEFVKYLPDIAFFVVETDKFMLFPTIFILELLLWEQAVYIFMSLNILR